MALLLNKNHLDHLCTSPLPFAGGGGRTRSSSFLVCTAKSAGREILCDESIMPIVMSN